MDRPNVQNLLVQMNDGQMDRLCHVNLDRPNRRRSNGPPMLRQFGPSKCRTAKFRPNGQYVFVYLDASKLAVQGRPNGWFRDVRGDVNPK